HTNSSQPSNGTNGEGLRACLPRRIVLLAGNESSEVEKVLAEWADGSGSHDEITAQLQTLAAQHAGRYVAVEWLGKVGWNRFLWCRH
ncbi:MAG TPA: hypothetical protein VFA18_21860, partial [Gemmataceae bacterium]|nr:hypothetical protein [Gemmataceae bacterium]